MLKSLIDIRMPDEFDSIVFTGSLYEPRTSILNAINVELNKKGLNIDIKGRNLGAKRFSDAEYWSNLVDASIVITTSSQICSNETDWDHLPHLIYRYLEVPASGSLLLAPIVPSIERFFKPNEHFVSFNSIEEAVEKIEFYLNNSEERKRIAMNGYLKAHSIINSNLYWVNIDLALGRHSLL
jgi:spore maturation protein CgeB